MKRAFSRSFPIACLLVGGLSLSAIAQTGTTTAPTGTTKVAVINFQAAVFQTNEGRKNIAALQQKFEPKKQQLKTEADEITALKKQLQADASKLTDAQRQTRTQAIDEKEKNLQRDGEDASSDYQQQMEQTYQQLAEKVYGSLQTYAKSNGFGVVLDESSSAQQPPTVLWRTDAADITKAVIDAYNVKSGVPAPAPSSTMPSAPASHARPSGGQ